jgi:hypothetical protein
LADCFPETFAKRLVGRKDVEDALQRLEKVTVEEARMAGAEALKAIHDRAHGIHDAVKAVEDRVRDVEGIIKGVDAGVKGIRDMVITGTRALFHLSLLSMFTATGVEKQGRQTANDPETAAGKSSEISDEAEAAVDSEAQGMRNVLKDVSNRARNLNRVLMPVSEIEDSGMDGAQAIHNNSSIGVLIRPCI